MDVKYKITFNSQSFIIKELAISAIVFLIGYLVLVKYYDPGEEIMSAIICLTVYVVLQLIPSLILHLQYLKYNKTTSFSINESERIMSITDTNMTSSYGFDQIKYIWLITTYPLYRGARRGIGAWQLYHYSVIEMKDGKQFVVSCLLVNNQEKFYDALKLQTYKRTLFYPLIYTKWDRSYTFNI